MAAVGRATGSAHAHKSGFSRFYHWPLNWDEDNMQKTESERRVKFSEESAECEKVTAKTNDSGHAHKVSTDRKRKPKASSTFSSVPYPETSADCKTQWIPVNCAQNLLTPKRLGDAGENDSQHWFQWYVQLSQTSMQSNSLRISFSRETAVSGVNQVSANFAPSDVNVLDSRYSDLPRGSVCGPAFYWMWKRDKENVRNELVSVGRSRGLVLTVNYDVVLICFEGQTGSVLLCTL